jgi:hypothetical protein
MRRIVGTAYSLAIGRRLPDTGPLELVFVIDDERGVLSLTKHEIGPLSSIRPGLVLKAHDACASFLIRAQQRHAGRQTRTACSISKPIRRSAANQQHDRRY